MEAEFNEIEEKNLWTSAYQEIREEASKYKYTSKDGRKPENKALNRYRDVTPFDHCRVRLERIANNYINASFIKVDDAERAYILTQGPLVTTVCHFWLMIWEQRSVAIVMLNRLIERGQIKCHQYWPDEEDETLPLEDVRLAVDYVSEEPSTYYTIRKFLLRDLQSGQSREVTQYHYTAWPDFGLPESPSSFLEFLFAVRRSGAFDQNKYGPPVIHCSAGIGRSGTLCLVDTCLVLVEKYQNPNKVNVRQVLLDMRRYRMGLIQTAEQLRFSYMAITKGIKSFVSVPLSNSNDGISNSIQKIACNNEETHEEAEDSVNSDGEQNPTLPLLPPRNKRSQSITSQSSSAPSEPKSSTPSSSNSVAPEQDQHIPPKAATELTTNNNVSSAELRRRNREERNQKMEETIKRIKEKQKEIAERSRLKTDLIKYGCISVGIAAVIGTGLLFYNHFLADNSSSNSLIKPTNS